MQQSSSQSRSSANNSFPTVQVHGVLVRVFGTGVLIIGESGIGKSECALDLVTRGHKLVADDVIEILDSGEKLSGRAPALTYELLEIRGLGIINVRRAFGDDAVCEVSSMELCVELQKDADVERIGNIVGKHVIAGRSLPKFVLPVQPGRNLATLVETAARIFINRDSGPDTGDLLVERQKALLEAVPKT
jgi:HPr kinase/phosphorylase